MGSCGSNSKFIVVKPGITQSKKVSDDYEMLTSDRIIGVDTSVKVITITLPLAEIAGEKIFWVKDISGNAFNNNIIIETPVGNTIIDVSNGQTSSIIGVNGGALQLSCDGIDEYWVI